MIEKIDEPNVELKATPGEVGPGLANREERNRDYSQLSHIALRRMAETQDEGNRKYGRGNWQRGLPLSNLLSHAMEHILHFQNGDTTEDHLAHAAWNLEKAMHFQETRPDLVDVPVAGSARRIGLYQCHGCLIYSINAKGATNLGCAKCGARMEEVADVICNR